MSETTEQRIANFLQAARRQDVVRHCDPCGGQQVKATIHCYQCRRNFCEQCKNKHGQFESFKAHNTTPISVSMYCSAHSSELALMFCEECKDNICPDCVFSAHSEHKVVDITSVAEESRSKLREFINAQSTANKDVEIVDNIKLKLAEGKEDQTRLDISITKMKNLLKELETQIATVEEGSKAKLSTELERLTAYESEASGMITSGKGLSEYALYLVEEASNQELVKQERNFPLSKLSGLATLAKETVELPLLENVFEPMCSKLEEVIKDCVLPFRKVNIGISPFNKPTLLNTIATGQAIKGMTLDLKRQWVIVRTNDPKQPIKAFDYSGEVKETIGEGVTGIADGNWRGICIDTKRDVYMVPCQNTLKLLNRNGDIVNIVEVGSYNSGVAYAAKEDLYIVTDFQQHKVAIINPNTFEVVTQFGSRGPAVIQFQGPYNVLAGQVAGLENTMIIVSDHNNHCVKLFDINGEHVKTFGRRGNAIGQLDGPWGLCIDPTGRIVVSDAKNCRLVSFWNDGNEDQSDCVLKGLEDRCPWHLTADLSSMLLMVVCSNESSVDIYKC